MHAAPLPRRASQDRADRLLQSFVGIGDREPDPGQAALHEPPQKHRPETAILRAAHIHPEDLALPSKRDADRHHRRAIGSISRVSGATEDPFSDTPPATVFFCNNTVLSETSVGSTANAHWRNNLMLPSNAAAAIFSVNTYTNYSSSDYNGFGMKAGATPAFQWNSPAWSTARLDAQEPASKLEQRKYATFEEYVRDTKQDQHSVLVDYDVFVNVPRLDARDLQAVQRLYRASDLDFRLKPGSAAVDRGVAIPNVTDGFAGGAPDLGALELGRTPPAWGPRPSR